MTDIKVKESKKGTINKTVVATQLLINEHDLIYWESGNTAEIDFVLYTNDGLIPLEVKADTNVTSKSLNLYMKRYNPKYAIRVCAKNFGFANNIKSVLLYAVYLIK